MDFQLQRTSKEARRCCKKKEMKKEKTGSEISITESVNSGSGPEYQINIPLGWAPW
jgi:hypothetical protein